jgi:small conductance mechanosensitive channel
MKQSRGFLMNEQLETLEYAKRTAIDLAIQFGPKVLVALIIIAVGFALGRWAAQLTERAVRRLEVDPSVRHLIARIVHIFVLALFVVMALQNIGVELLPLLAGVGLAGAGIALAMQGVLGNLVAGLVIIFSHPYRLGEYISIVGVEGEVIDIGLFNTTLRHPDRSHVIVPNRRIMGEVLHNYGSIRQLAVIVRVAYDTDLNRALSVIDETLRSNPRLLKEPAPVVQVSVLSDFSINIAVRPWVAVPDFVTAQGEINKAIVEAFRGEQIVIPLPQREVRMLAGS